MVSLNRINLSSPIIKNIIANLFRVLIIFLNQIVLVPLYIQYWGTATYGDWLVLTAITSFFTMSDMGLNNVSNNRFCIKHAEKNYEECNSLLVNNAVLIGSIGIISVLGMLIFVSSCNLQNMLGLHEVDNTTAAIVLVVSCAYIFINMLGGVFDSIYNANHLASRATYINNFTKLAYAILLLICVVVRIEMSILILIVALPYIGSMFFKVIDSRRYYVYDLKSQNFDRKLFEKLIKPSLAYLGFPISNAISFQGYTLVVNSFFGAVPLVLFNTTRTLVNFVRTLVETVTNGIKPELSIAYGERNGNRLRHVYKKALIITFVLAISCCLFLIVFGKMIYVIWTHNAVEFDTMLMLSFMLVIILNTLQNASCAIVLATNNHQVVALISMILSIIGLGIAYLLASTNSLPLVACTIAIPEVGILVYSVVKVKKIINRIS